MPSVDDATENVIWAAADAFLSNYLDDLLEEIFERVEEEWEEGEEYDPSDMVEEVVADWISRPLNYDVIQNCIYEQIDNECMYTSDCMEIIIDYGFSESLSAAEEMGCDLSDVTESAVASAVLTMYGPTEGAMQDEIIRQIQECSSYLERVAEYENGNQESADEEECEEEDDEEDEVEEDEMGDNAEEGDA